MTGHIKTGGSWKTASKLAVNIAGTWKTASVGYIKVAGAWKQWFAALITDNFARTVAGSLGSTPLGIAWTNLRGTWFANGSQAQSDDAGSTSALAAVPLGSADATVSASVSGGVGVAFWVSDANSWWAAVPYYNQTSQNVYNNCCTTTPYCNNCGQYYTGSCYTPSSTTYTSADYTYVCSSGGELSTCSGTPQIITCHVKSYTYSCPTGTYYSGGSCYYDASGYKCTTCTVTTTCSSTTYQASRSYYCTSGTLSGTQCATTTYGTPTADCGSGSYSSGSCPSPTCYRVVSGGTWPNCSCGSGSSCNGCTETVYSQYYYLRLLSSAAGNVTSPAGDEVLGAPAAAVKVVTSGSSVTAQAYSDTAMTTTLGSAVTATSSAVKGTSHGIIKIKSDYNQGSTADDFSAGI